MKLYIQVKYNQPVNHPSLESNVLEVFGGIPENWEPFVRVEMPSPPLYKALVSQTPDYVKVNGIWTDVWSFRDMTAEEKAEVIRQVTETFRGQPQAENWATWVFDEPTCTFKAPIPKPIDGKYYRWSGADNNWKEAPPQPSGAYRFDFFQWVWVPF